MATNLGVLCLLVSASWLTGSFGHLIKRSTVPHNCHPGYVISSLTFWGQDFFLSSPARKDARSFFSVLNNGDVITNTDVTELLGEKITLIIKSILGTNSWTDAVHIDIQNGHNILIFSQQLYDGRIRENQAAGIIVSDLEDIFAEISSVKRNIHYKWFSGDADSFDLQEIDGNRVQIISTQSLDREEKEKYLFTLKAWTDLQEDEPAYAKVKVTVIDENDNIPEFKDLVGYISIPESTPALSPVFTVSAIDPDKGTLQYFIDPPNDLFTIESQTGRIILNSRVNLRPQSYIITVYAEDPDGQKSEPFSVTVDVHGSSLKFIPHKSSHSRKKREVRAIKEVEIPEIYTGNLLTLESAPNDRFAIKEPCPENLEIHPITGTVRVKDRAKLDYEHSKEIDFIVLITRQEDASLPDDLCRFPEPCVPGLLSPANESGTVFVDEQPIKIKLTDVNDEIPRFVNVPRPFLSTVATNAAPGSSVYHLMAQDDDEDSDILYNLESGGEDRFEVDRESGVVRTKGNQPFRLGKEYEIGVSATDRNAGSNQKSPTHSLKILVGERDPQFFKSQYVAEVPETAEDSYEIVTLKAFSHQGYPITYMLTTESGEFESREFDINQHSGVVDLLRKLDYEKDPQQYHLRVKAIENGRPERTSTVSLIINLVDENDNTPTFPLSQYIVQGIAETVAVGTDIIQVTATDLDSVTNSQLTYSVSDGNFTVQSFNNIGYIKTAKRLDYDYQRDHTYNFTIVATDNGEPARSGSAMVRVTVTNVNDEDPVFAQSIEHVQVSEDAPRSTLVHVVQAYDPDGDDITYAFKGGRLSEGPFNIDPKSGIITLVGLMDKSQVAYKLNVTATDNGRCCGGSTSRSSRGLVIVEIKDINNNAPTFPQCHDYNPTVREKEKVSTPVIQVAAVDHDTGANGNVTYSIVKSSDQSSVLFYIEPTSGVLRTADIFDREAKTGVTDYGVTVKAEDQGSPTLAGFCTFRVKIGDMNDNPPVFDFHEYTTSLEESSTLGKKVIQVYATDRDAGENGRVEYSIVEDNSGFFSIDRHSGWITVSRPMEGTKLVNLRVKAEDRGSPAKVSVVSVKITITQMVNSYPQWLEDYSQTPIKLSENAPRDYTVKRLKAVSTMLGNPYVNYIIQQGDTPEQNGPPVHFHSRIDESTNEMMLMVYNPLDFEVIPRFTLTIKAANRAGNSISNDTRLTVELIDENDEIPQFVGLNKNGRYQGSVAENMDVGTEVITVTAVDRDDKAAYSRVSYRVKEIYDHDKFQIDPESGLIRTTSMFDREKQSEFYIMVVAEDGARSDRPNHSPPGTPNRGEAEVQIHITDKNDNTPYFKESIYFASVPENTDTGQAIITVTAEDKDEENQLTYSITGGNIGNAFEVIPEVGAIKVRGKLDYENGARQYRLVYRVFDDKYANSTTIVIHVTDVNDNPPKFDNAIYNITDVMEEEPGISESSPKYLLTVRATDPDTDRDSNIIYGLTGQFADARIFKINERSGEIYLTRSLDRDHPQGRPTWNFNVLAHDEPHTGHSLVGYAEVRVMPKDVNDNAPVFDRNRLTGRVQEHSRAGLSVMTVIATDADAGNNGSVSYSLKQVPMKGSTPLFSIDSSTGLISTQMSDSLDREEQSEYRIIVQAKDRGAPPMSSSATVTIKVTDINDHRPQFTQKIYRATMSESLAKGASITSVSATDDDEGANARLTYTLKESDRQLFSMTSVEATNTGVLKVFNPVDYDSLTSPFFNLTVYVHDPDTSHIDTAHIEVFVTDYNDNPPMFSPSSLKVSVFENITIGRSLARFSAEDKDTGVNKQFEFSIERSTDPHKQFAIDGNGLVTTARELDRETLDVHRIHILAIDKGTPAQTGFGTLIVTLVDVNDNFPVFADDYRPIVYENELPGQTVIEISGRDRDSATNGPPFKFWLPSCKARGEKCPCHINPTCHLFGFEFKEGGGSENHGTGIVTSMDTFDREKQKEYYMPIVMMDSGDNPKSGTNTLTIIIGDKNDNLHKPGHKEIFVYNYKGQFKNVPLGNVYAEDPDDWDVVDKTFDFESDKTEEIFRLDGDNGMLFTREKIFSGIYKFNVRVYDRIWKRSATSSVTVTVAEIGDDAVFSSGSLRITGTTAEEFVHRPKLPGATDVKAYGKSKYDMLREKLASKLKIPVENVDIFTIYPHPQMDKTIDVRYAAHNSPYYHAARLDGIVADNIKEFEDELAIRIAMVPVDECLDERCESGGCSNRLITSSEPNVVNTNATSLIGVTSYIMAECTCAAREFSINDTAQCQPDSCLNGGTCNINGQTVTCVCPPEFDGPRCQQTRHSFSGNSWAWYKPLAQCEQSHTSLEFVTTKDTGLMFYNGPIHELKDDDPEDFIILELRGGYPVLRLNHGSGEAKLTVDGRDSKGRRQLSKLNDGTWHRIDIFRNGKIIRMVIDRCESAVIEENENTQTSMEDRNPCEQIHETPGASKYINVNTPLQLGGRANKDVTYPRNVLEQGFTGCIKNLLHNGQLYDLHIGRVGQHKNSEDGCPREDRVCGMNDIEGPKCGINGTCVGSFLVTQFHCVCKPGWRGPKTKCSIPTTTKDFQDESYIEWDFKDPFYMGIEEKRHLTDLQLMFRTRQPAGLLFKGQNAHKSEYLTLEIESYRLHFRFNLGSGEQSLELAYVNVSDGEWHTAYIERVGSWVTLKLDGGEGRFYNSTPGGIAGSHLHIRVSQRSLFAGGDVRFSSSNSIVLVNDDFKESCMNDIRYGGEWFPMDRSQNGESEAAVVARSDNLGAGCESNACAAVNCPKPLVCVDMWRHAECQCQYGQRRVPGPEVCVNINECLEYPCIHGKCEDLPHGFVCRCDEGYEGELCPAKRESAVAHVSMGAILAIIICLLVLLLVILLFIVYSRRRRPEQYVVGVDPEDDVRENIIHYDEEGVVYEGSNKDGNQDSHATLRHVSKIYYFPRGGPGEEDQDTYDISRLKKPIVPDDTYKKPPPPLIDEKPPKERPRMQQQPIAPTVQSPPADVGKFIKDRQKDADNEPNAPPHDSVREYAYEGTGSDAGSLSSLASTEDTNDQDFDYLDNWGPRFSKLANMYGGPPMQ